MLCFDDLVESTATKKKTTKLGSNSFRPGSDFYFGHPDPDPSDLYRGASESDVIDVAHRTASASTPPPPPAPVKVIVKPVARLIQSGKLMQPRAIPKEVAVFKEAELPPDVINPAQTNGVFGGIPGRASWPVGRDSSPAEGGRAIPHQAGRTSNGRVNHHADEAALSRAGASSAYSGNVVLHAIIDKEGKVASWK